MNITGAFMGWLCAMTVNAQVTITSAAVQGLEGTWRGELMYVDYTSGEETHIHADLLVQRLDSLQWRIGFGYADEPHANRMDTMALAQNGTSLDGMQVTGLRTFTPDSVEVLLGGTGEDDGVPVRIRKTWTIGPHTCFMRKEVAPLATGEDHLQFMLRHEYRFLRQ